MFRIAERLETHDYVRLKKYAFMKEKVIITLRYVLFIIIPVLSVGFCMLFKIAQGEKSEEIVFGVMVGIALDFIYSIFLLLLSRKSNRT